MTASLYLRQILTCADKVNQHKSEFEFVRDVPCISLSPGYLEGQFGQELAQGSGNGEFDYATDSDFRQRGELNKSSLFGSRLQCHVRQSKDNCKAHNRDCPRLKNRSRAESHAAEGCLKKACNCTQEAVFAQAFGEVYAQVQPQSHSRSGIVIAIQPQ